MPFLGHRSPDLADLGVSPVGAAPVLAQSTTLEQRVAVVIAGVARDDDDRALLLEALGLAPTSRDRAAVAG